jgi:hypothetical protein
MIYNLGSSISGSELSIKSNHGPGQNPILPGFYWDFDRDCLAKFWKNLQRDKKICVKSFSKFIIALLSIPKFK